MAFDILYPTDDAQVHRHSSIDQFRDFLSTMVKGGWAPIVFDQLDGVVCGVIKYHPIIIAFGDNSFIYPEGRCVYASETFIYTDKEGIETKILPECFGGGGEVYDAFIKSNSFINFDGPDGGSSLGVHNQTTLRVGLDYVKADRSLPAVD